MVLVRLTHIRRNKMEWKFKKGAEPQGSSDGFWYDIAYGGCIDLDALINDEQLIMKIEDAITLLSSLETALFDAGLLNEF